MDGPLAQPRPTNGDARSIYRPATILGCWVALAATVALFFSGDAQGKLMFHQQPMKMASAESLCDTQTDPEFSILTVGRQNNCDSLTRVIEVPYVLPFLAEGQIPRRHAARRARHSARLPTPIRRRTTTDPTSSSPTGPSAR